MKHSTLVNALRAIIYALLRALQNLYRNPTQSNIDSAINNARERVYDALEDYLELQGLTYSLPTFKRNTYPKLIGLSPRQALIKIPQIVVGERNDLIEQIIFNNKTVIGFMRICMPGACWLCALLASRGAVYKTEESARGRMGTRNRIRNAFHEGMAGTHPNCRCIIVPMIEGDKLGKQANELRAIWDSVYRPGDALGNQDRWKQVWKKINKKSLSKM